MCIYVENGMKMLLKIGTYDMKLPFKNVNELYKNCFSNEGATWNCFQMNIKMCEYICSIELPLKCMNMYANEMWTYSKNDIQNGVGRQQNVLENMNG